VVEGGKGSNKYFYFQITHPFRILPGSIEAWEELVGDWGSPLFIWNTADLTISLIQY